MDSANYYTILGVAKAAGSPEIRQCYRAALLKVHPDKSQVLHEWNSAAIAISQIQEAYRTLSDPVLREKYDQLLKEGKGIVKMTQVDQRPANEVSLDDFEEIEANGSGVAAQWIYPCRCGNLFTITEDELEKEVHYIGCAGCSEVLWVGYEAVDGISTDGDNKACNK
ncbi:DnaJ domain-containing protein [Ceratobasidium theobromae]|uniref:Diphthamide biosynthesis protein 4 n=1 Tax=Ceratobasidium theobromae TaxID=1582974 RepID=A0A5N5QSM4_9AGAM|nr:DnaJ domain-containing protein [Ceratobasidium theobromae]